MDDYLCLTIRSARNESEKDFKGRISTFWSEVCRGKPLTFETVYAETSEFENDGTHLSRKYLVETATAEEVLNLMAACSLDPEPLNADEVYSKFEATPPEWFWIEH